MPNRSFAAFAAILAGLCANGAERASAQVSGEIAASAAGPMLILPVDGSPGCRIDLKLKRTIGGRVAIPFSSCANRLPRLATVTAWFIADGIHLLDGARRPVMAFSTDETGLHSSPSVSNPDHYMVAARPKLTRVPTVAQSAGRWRMESSRSSAQCNLTLTATKLDGTTTYGVSPMKGCPVTGLTSWRIEALTLFLEGPNDRQIAFERTSDTRFDGPNGLRLVR